MSRVAFARSLNAILAFGLELAMLGALAWAGFEFGRRPLMNWFALLAAPAFAILIWGLFNAPRARRRLPLGPRTALELSMQLIAALALWALGQLSLAVAMAALSIASQMTTLVAGEFDGNA